jgi:hypothetical protein
MPLIQRILRGALIGGAVSLCFLGIGLLRAAFALFGGTKVSFDGTWPEGLWYVGGFVVGGAAVGLCWPVRSYRAGRIGIWILGMVFVMLAILRMESGPPSMWKAEDFWIGGILAVFFGVAAAVGFERG